MTETARGPDWWQASDGKWYPPQPEAPQPVPVMWGIPGVRPFVFDGGAGSYLGVSILAFLVTFLTFGICLPWAICMRQRWRSNHTLIYGNRMSFTGTAASLFGNWIKWFLLCIITLGIYGFWVVPRLTQWVVEHQHV